MKILISSNRHKASNLAKCTLFYRSEKDERQSWLDENSFFFLVLHLYSLCWHLKLVVNNDCLFCLMWRHIVSITAYSISINAFIHCLLIVCVCVYTATYVANWISQMLFFLTRRLPNHIHPKSFLLFISAQFLEPVSDIYVSRCNPMCCFVILFKSIYELPGFCFQLGPMFHLGN